MANLSKALRNIAKPGMTPKLRKTFLRIPIFTVKKNNETIQAKNNMAKIFFSIIANVRRGVSNATKTTTKKMAFNPKKSS